jgi:hypothetical protein
MIVLTECNIVGCLCHLTVAVGLFVDYQVSAFVLICSSNISNLLQVVHEYCNQIRYWVFKIQLFHKQFTENICNFLCEIVSLRIE